MPDGQKGNGEPMVESGFIEIRPKEKGDRFGVLILSLLVIALAAVGIMVSSAAWGVYSIFRPIPELFGRSRFWIDFWSAPFYAIFVAINIGSVISDWQETNEDEDFYWTFWEFLGEDWLYPARLIFAVVNLALSIFFSLALGLGLYILATIVFLIILAVPKVVGWFSFLGFALGGVAKEG